LISLIHTLTAWIRSFLTIFPLQTVNEYYCIVTHFRWGGRFLRTQYTKNYWNRSTFDSVILKNKNVAVFWDTVNPVTCCIFYIHIYHYWWIKFLTMVESGLSKSIGNVIHCLLSKPKNIGLNLISSSWDITVWKMSSVNTLLCYNLVNNIGNLLLLLLALLMNTFIRSRQKLISKRN